jgi:exosortase D (VPLPA-CTERM-specific)
MFPILSFSYLFAVLYRGPMWHKAVLLISAAPIAILMNSVRIAVAGIMVQYFGNGWLEGATHFFEGWVMFLICILMLILLAWVLLFLRRDKLSLTEALDLDFDGLGPQVARLQYVLPSKALITSVVLGFAFLAAAFSIPERGTIAPERDPFAIFPRSMNGWEQQGPRQILGPATERALAADDYHQVDLLKAEYDQPVGLFMAYYNDQSKNGVHSPEVCLPGAGWEIAWLERSDLTEVMGSETPFMVNRAIIQKGQVRMMVYYWFQQRERRIAWDLAAKYYLLVDGVTTGRTDGALVRLTTVINRADTSDQAALAKAEEDANERLLDALKSIDPNLPRYIPMGLEF